jgi:hypothetical protein
VIRLVPTAVITAHMGVGIDRGKVGTAQAS